MLHHPKQKARHFGFNHPNPTDETFRHGYEAWLTIPDQMTVPEPYNRKQFAGGLYGALMINFGDFYKWDALLE